MYIIVDFYTLLCEKLYVTPMTEFIVKDFQMSVPLFVDFAQGIYFSSRNNLEPLQEGNGRPESSTRRLQFVPLGHDGFEVSESRKD